MLIAEATVSLKEERRSEILIWASVLVVEETGAKCTRMKNFLDVGSPNCCESTMLRLCWARNPVTA